MVQRSASLGRAVAVLVWLLLAVGASAQTRPLTIEGIFGYEGWTRFNGNATASLGWVPQNGRLWLDAERYLWPGGESGGNSWLAVDAATGSSRPLFANASLESALLKAGVARDEAARLSRRRPTNFNPAFDGFLLTAGDDLYYYGMASSALTRLTRSTGAKTEATFSPDGRTVAFVKDNNLYATSVDSPAERALTGDGTPDLLNGKFDWVYSEELYGRGTHRAYWWSPDSSRIAFIQLNQKDVPEYTLVDDIPYHPAVERWKYPKAGDPNPIARLGVVETGGTLNPVTWIDTTRYQDFLIVSVAWSPDSRSVMYQIQNRQQTWLDLNRADRHSGAAATLLRESGRAWVERWQDAYVDPVWLADGTFLWLSERSGWRHLYHYRPDGSLIRAVTAGDWEVRALHGADARGVLFSATERSAIGLDIYRIGLDGTGMRRLSETPGRHKPFFNPTGSLYIDSWTDVSTPPQARLHRSDRPEPVRVVDANPVVSLQDYGFAKPELLQVKTRDGFAMEAMMIKPPNFDPARRYPVYQFTYAGPHNQQVQNSWGYTDFLYHQLLAQHGIIVWICDNRTSSGKGAQSAWPLQGNLGELELRDIEDGIDWLKRQPYVDGSRIGIAGVSYGGYMATYALTHSKAFAMGIAEGAVTDWRDYDTIYTERYMGLPKDNPDGYRRSSPRFSAAGLSGELLLIHSALDDNVHPQNTMQFAYELQKAGKPFQMMVYPKSTHGVGDPQLVLHMRRMMLDFTLKNLKAE